MALDTADLVSELRCRILRAKRADRDIVATKESKVCCVFSGLIVFVRDEDWLQQLLLLPILRCARGLGSGD